MCKKAQYHHMSCAYLLNNYVRGCIPSKIISKLLIAGFNDKNLHGKSDGEPFADTNYLVPHITTG